MLMHSKSTNNDPTDDVINLLLYSRKTKTRNSIKFEVFCVAVSTSFFYLRIYSVTFTVSFSSSVFVRVS